MTIIYYNNDLDDSVLCKDDIDTSDVELRDADTLGGQYTASDIDSQLTQVNYFNITALNGLTIGNQKCYRQGNVVHISFYVPHDKYWSNGIKNISLPSIAIPSNNTGWIFCGCANVANVTDVAQVKSFIISAQVYTDGTLAVANDYAAIMYGPRVNITYLI